MAGKGDKRRPQDISHEDMQSNWDKIFKGGAKGGKFRECPETGSWITEEEYWAKVEEREQIHYVQPDLEPFKLPGKDGEVIMSRRQWKNHLAKNNAIEMGHSDIRARQRDMDKEYLARERKHHEARKQVLIDVANSRGMAGYYEPR